MELLQTFLSEQTIRQIGWVLIHFLWQGVAVMALLWCVLKMLGKASSNTRYVVACAGLVLMALAPAATFMMLSDDAPVAVVEPVSPSPAVSEARMPAETRVITFDDAQPEPIVLPEPSLTETVMARLEAALPYCVIGWFLGVAALSVWYLGGWCQLQKLRRIGTKTVSDCVEASASLLAQRLGIRRAVGIVESALVQVPTVIGWLKPVILLPATALTGLDEVQLRAMIAHELAHIKRCDYGVNIAQTVVEILGFYHPAVWWASRQIRVERENCCDDIAIQLLQSPKEYAKALFSMEAIRAKQLNLAVAANGAPLTNRIARLIGNNPNPHPKSGWIPSVIAILMIIGLLIPAALALKTDGKVIETKDLIGLTNVKPDEMTVERLADICEAIESSIFDVAVDYQWYVDPPTTGKDIAGTGLLTTVDKAEHFWATMRPFSQFSLTSMSANFTDGGNSNFHSTTRQSFNGKIGKYLQIVKRPDGAASNPDGTITKSRRFMEAQSLNPSTFSIFHFTKDGPLSKLLKMKELEVELNKSVVAINGFNAIAVEINRSYNQQKMLIYRIYFAVDYNYTPIRFEHTNGREVVHAVNIDQLEEVSKGLWYPAGGRIVPTDEESSNIYKASKIIVNQGLTPEYFVLEFPPGTHVLDERTHTQSIVKPTKEQKEKIDEEQKIIEENAAEVKASQKEGGRLFSVNKLFKLGQAKAVYMMDHKKFPESMQDLKPYLDDETFFWLAENVVWLNTPNIAETTDLSTTPIAYDKTLLNTQDGTTVLFADGHVEFVKKESLKNFINKAGDEDNWGKAVQGVSVRLHSPDVQWDRDQWVLFFKTDLMSQTERILPHYGAPIEEFFAEVDGHLYRRVENFPDIRSVGPSPATLRENLHTSIVAKHWRSMSGGQPMPELTPGRHTIRIGFPLSNEPDADGKRPMAVSNTVVVEIPDAAITPPAMGGFGGAKPADEIIYPKNWDEIVAERSKKRGIDPNEHQVAALADPNQMRTEIYDVADILSYPGTNRKPAENIEELMRTIILSIVPESWYDNGDGGDGTIDVYSQSKLVIYQTPQVHKILQEYFKMLREGLSKQIAIETRILLITDSFLEDIGLDTSLSADYQTSGGVGQIVVGPANSKEILAALEHKPLDERKLPLPGTATQQSQPLDDLQMEFLLRATQAHQNSKQLTAPKVMVLNGESACIQIQKDVKYTDFDDAEKAVPAGLILDIKPIISADQQEVILSGHVQFSEVLENQTVESGGRSYEIPLMQAANIPIHAMVENTETLFIPGPELMVIREIKEPLPERKNPSTRLFSYSTKVTEKQRLLILIKPTIIKQDEQEEDAIGALAPRPGDGLK
jgi:prepilin-type processing-associated H-X9-DG protein